MPQCHGSFVAFSRKVRQRRRDRSHIPEAPTERADMDCTCFSDVAIDARDVGLLSILRIAKAPGTTVSEIALGVEK